MFLEGNHKLDKRIKSEKKLDKRMQNKNIAIKRMWVRIEIKINKLEGNHKFFI